MPAEENKTMVLLPVTVSLLVPVEIDATVTVEGEEHEIDGVPVVDVMQYDNGEQMIVDALQAAAESQDFEDALGCLMSGAHLYKRTRPETKALYTPCMGIVDEKAF